MEGAVHHQMRRMRFDRNVFLRRFAGADAVREDDVTKQDLAAVGPGDGIEKLSLDHRERKDVGRLVVAAIAGVQRLDLLIIGEADRDFHDKLRFVKPAVAAACNGGMDSALGKRRPVDPIVPLLAGIGFDEDHSCAPQARSSRAQSRGVRDELVPTPLDFARDERRPVRAKLTYKDQRDYDLLPARIEEIEAAIARDEQALADPDLYTRAPKRFAQLMATIEKARAERDAAEERWLELAEQVEALAG